MRILAETFTKKIFDILSIIKPVLYCPRTEEELLWNEKFGDDWEKIKQDNYSSLMSGLIENDCGYEFADSVIEFDGTSRKLGRLFDDGIVHYIEQSEDLKNRKVRLLK